MKWNTLTTEDQFNEIIEKSLYTPQVIFKHSVRCNISGVAKNRLERASAPNNIEFSFVNVIANRALSNKIAEHFQIQHETPQVLLIKNKECIYSESHFGISMDEIAFQLMAA